MKTGNVSTRCPEDVMVSRRIRDLRANVGSGSIHQAINEWRAGILKDLLSASTELIKRLYPIVVLHSDNEYRAHCGCTSGRRTAGSASSDRVYSCAAASSQKRKDRK